jgi:hypothetical protein
MRQLPAPSLSAATLVALALLTTFSAAAQAEAALGEHPAVLVQRHAVTIDPNTFVVAHPAGLALRRGHAGYEHPAVAARRDAGSAGIDANVFIVQPPATAAWIASAPVETQAQVALATR